MHTQHDGPISLFLSRFRKRVDVILLFLNELHVDFQVCSSAYFRSVRQSHGTLTDASLIPRAGVALQN